MSKITVISQRGKLVGVWLPPPGASDPNAPVSRPVGGPGQKVHDLEVGDVAAYHDRSKATELAKLVRKKLKLT
jgi:hypothetical protein